MATDDSLSGNKSNSIKPKKKKKGKQLFWYLQNYPNQKNEPNQIIMLCNGNANWVLVFVVKIEIDSIQQ